MNFDNNIINGQFICKREPYDSRTNDADARIGVHGDVFGCTRHIFDVKR